jgi:hypothetical protein
VLRSRGDDPLKLSAADHPRLVDYQPTASISLVVAGGLPLHRRRRTLLAEALGVFAAPAHFIDRLPR